MADTVRNVKVTTETPAQTQPVELVYIQGGGTAVAKATGDAPTKAEFDALIDALAAAGVITVSE